MPALRFSPLAVALAMAISTLAHAQSGCRKRQFQDQEK